MRVLIVGLGSIAGRHIAALRSIDRQVEIYALRSSHISPHHEGVEDIYSLDGYEGNFDFAIISNPTSLHAPAIGKLLRLKIPLFIEKPLFESCGYDMLVENIKKSGVMTYVACNLRFLDSLRYLREYVENNVDKRINEVNVYCGSYLPQWRKSGDWRDSYSVNPALGGGVNIDLIHDIDYTFWIFGRPLSSRGLCRNVSSLDIEAPDFASYLLMYSGFTATVTLNYYRRDYKRTLEVVFEDDTWTVDIAANRITDLNTNVIYKGANSIADTYEDQMRYFVDKLKKRGNIENDISEAYEVLKICMDYERFD